MEALIVAVACLSVAILLIVLAAVWSLLRLVPVVQALLAEDDEASEQTTSRNGRVRCVRCSHQEFEHTQNGCLGVHHFSSGVQACRCPKWLAPSTETGCYACNHPASAHQSGRCHGTVTIAGDTTPRPCLCPAFVARPRAH